MEFNILTRAWTNEQGECCSFFFVSVDVEWFLPRANGNIVQRRCFQLKMVGAFFFLLFHYEAWCALSIHYSWSSINCMPWTNMVFSFTFSNRVTSRNNFFSSNHRQKKIILNFRTKLKAITFVMGVIQMLELLRENPYFHWIMKAAKNPDDFIPDMENMQ